MASVLRAPTILVRFLLLLSVGLTLAGEPAKEEKDPAEVRRFQLEDEFDGWCLAFSPDGNFILTGNQLWETTSGKKIRQLDRAVKGYRHPEYLHSVCFSPDGKYVAGGVWGEYLGEPEIRLWEAATGKVVWKAVHSGAGPIAACFAPCVTFTPDGKHLLSGGGDGTGRLWAVATGKEVRRFEWERPAEKGDTDGSVVVSADGKLALVCFPGRTALLWELETGKELSRICFLGHPVAVASPDCRYMLQGVAGVGEGEVILRDARTGKEIRRFKAEASLGGIHCLAFSPDGRDAAGGSGTGRVHCWQVATGKTIQVFKGHEKGVNHVAFSPDGKFILSVSVDGDKTARLWRLKE